MKMQKNTVVTGQMEGKRKEEKPPLEKASQSVLLLNQRVYRAGPKNNPSNPTLPVFSGFHKFYSKTKQNSGYDSHAYKKREFQSLVWEDFTIFFINHPGFNNPSP